MSAFLDHPVGWICNRCTGFVADNSAEREMSASACSRCMPGFYLALISSRQNVSTLNVVNTCTSDVSLSYFVYSMVAYGILSYRH